MDDLIARPAATGRPGLGGDEEGYVPGFGNHVATEALPGALPIGRNSPQRVPYGLYAEQVSGTAFTAPRAENRRAWLYRIRPAVMHPPFRQIPNRGIAGRFDEVPASPNQLRWDPLPMPGDPADFVDGLVTMAGNGSPAAQLQHEYYRCWQGLRKNFDPGRP